MVLPYICSSPSLCPASVILQFLSMAGKVPYKLPLLTFQQSEQFIVLIQDNVCKRLSTLLTKAGLPAAEYGTLSLRKGGATWLPSSVVLLEVIKAVGDWQSDCIERYLKPNVSEKLKTVNTVSQNLLTT